MIIPMCCFTCGLPIAHLYDKYLEDVKFFSKGIPSEKLHSDDDPRGQVTPEFLAMAKHGIHRECCRRMFECQHDMFEFIN